MLDCFSARAAKGAVSLTPITEEEVEKKKSKWMTRVGFKGKAGSFCPMPGEKDGFYLGIGKGGLWDWAAAPKALPPHRYQVEGKLSGDAILGWALGSYRYTRYKEDKSKQPVLTLTAKHEDRALAERLAEAQYLVRDLINTPPSDMGPADLAAAARKVAKKSGARVTVITGKALLDKNYPTIHTVGRASAREPRLIDMRWGNTKHPKVTLVGKGVCFDTGGLDLKPADGMLLMKKDMGGAAHVLGIAQAVMDAKLKVRLRVLIPAVENSVDGNAYRPSDIIKTRSGITVEVGNTDAEGRLVLCDALAEAVREEPDLIMDFATLTGAARVALGTGLPAMFTNDDDVAAAFTDAGEEMSDPVWRMPLFDEYRRLLDSRVADINNISRGRFGGAITAALFLREFVGETKWVHFDVMAWNVENLPGRPVGGEAMGMRAAYEVIRALY